MTTKICVQLRCEHWCKLQKPLPGILGAERPVWHQVLPVLVSYSSLSLPGSGTGHFAQEVAPAFVLVASFHLGQMRNTGKGDT